MRHFLNSKGVVPLMLASILTLGTTFAWLVALMLPMAMFEPWLPDFDVVRTTALYGWVVAIVLLSPFMVAVILFVFVPLQYHGHPIYELVSLSDFWPPMFALCAGAAVLAVWCYQRHRRISVRGAFAWAIFVFVWGLPGFIGYLLHRRWPVMEVCLQCTQETPRDRDACLHCGATFPAPALKGIEIFA